MAHTYTNLLVHGIFSTKDRLPLIESEIKDELLAVIGGIIRNLKGRAYAINGTADHLHMLVSFPPSLAVSEAVQKIKANSSRWVHEKWPKRKPFGWQEGYGAFSVSKSNVPSVIRYIDTQEEHHRKVNFLKKSSSAFCRNMALNMMTAISGVRCRPSGARSSLGHLPTSDDVGYCYAARFAG